LGRELYELVSLIRPAIVPKEWAGGGSKINDRIASVGLEEISRQYRLSQKNESRRALSLLREADAP
jgi:hypothetical protein